jgi:hypothetical protein
MVQSNAPVLLRFGLLSLILFADQSADPIHQRRERMTFTLSPPFSFIVLRLSQRLPHFLVLGSTLYPVSVERCSEFGD